MVGRFLVLSAALTIALYTSSPLRAAYSELLPETTLAQSGLTRPWFGQVEIDRGRTRISNLALCEGVLYAQTNAAMVHAIDAETGKTLWSQQVGKSNHPSPPLEARGDLVAVVNGSRLYVLNRANGELLYQREVQDAPGAGPALSSKRAFVPMVTGMMTAYQFPRGVGSPGEPAKAKKDAADKKPPEADRQADARAIQATVPLCCQSYGRALVQPLVTRDFVGGEYVVWSTDRGYLNFGRIERDSDNVLALKYRLETGGAIVARPAYLPPNPKVLGDAGIVFAASTDGFVYAVQEENGSTLWRFSSGEPILQSPAVIDNRVYVTTELGAMYCLAVKTGKNLWSVAKRDAVCRGQQEPRLCRRPHRPAAGAQCRQRRPAGRHSRRKRDDQTGQCRHRPDLPGRRRRADPVPPRDRADRTAGARQGAQGGGKSRIEAAD